MISMPSYSRASSLRDSLKESEKIANGASHVLDGYSSQLQSLIKSVEHVADRAQVLTNAQKRVDNALKQASQLLQHMDTPGRVESKIKLGPKGGFSEFLAATARLDECNRFLATHSNMQAVEKSLRLGQLLQKEAITLACDEFQGILKRAARVIDLKLVRADADAFKTDALNNTQDILPSEMVDKLKRLHETMKKMGNTGGVKAFMEVRSSVMDKSMLASLDMKLLTPEEFNKLSWHAAEGRIRVWISIILGTCGQLAKEQRLSHQIFGGSEGREAYQGVMSPAVHFLYTRFIGKILGSKVVPEKIYGLLEAGEKLHNGLANLHLESGATDVLGEHFFAQSGNEKYSNKGEISLELAEDARATYALYCSTFKLEIPRSTVGHGSVHTLTAQVMTLCRRLSKYTSCPAILFGQAPVARLPFARVSTGGPNQDNAMQVGLEKLLNLLWSTLVGIASSCKNRAMACIFLTTNAHYMIKTIQQTDSLRIISEEWQSQCEAKLDEYGQKYQDLAWGSILTLIGDPSIVPEVRGLNWLKDKSQIKEKWRKINTNLSSVISEQKQWSIADPNLKANLRSAIIEDFMPSYKEFWENQQELKFSKNPGRYLKYSPEMLSDIIKREIFQSVTTLPSQDVSVRPDISSRPSVSIGTLTQTSITPSPV